MPYIDKESRVKFTKAIEEIGNNISSVGEMNYVISMICKSYIDKNGKSYKIFNDLMGIISGVDKELYRMVIAEYEDQKIEVNGKVY